jgi:hypothetical protein
MPSKPTEKKVFMARAVARRWLGKIAKSEYRLRVLYGAVEYKNLPNLLRSFRDGKVAVKGVSLIADLGVKEDFDGIELWSSNREALQGLQGWFEDRGFETSGVW